MSNKLKVNTDPKVKTVFGNYPKEVQEKLLFLRNLIIESANEVDEVLELQETLKWGEPSYITKIGSTLRIDWKPKNPNQYAMYFQCSSRLVPTFKLTFKNNFIYEGNRAIIFPFDNSISEEPLKSCIKAALKYHKVKHLPLLGL